MTKRFLFTTVFCSLFIVITTYAQDGTSTAIAVTPDIIQMNLSTVVRYHGVGDGLDVTTKESTAELANGADLIWGGFYQAQPNNPGILSLTSVSSPMVWNPCFIVRANGKVGIMNSNPSVALEIGSVYSIQQVKVNGNIVWGSDVRMKENVRELSNSLSQLKKLRGVSYHLKEEVNQDVIPDKIFKEGLVSVEKTRKLAQDSSLNENKLLARSFYGFLAQDVKELFPDLVYEDESTGMLSVDYIGLIPLLLDALKEQQEQIDEKQETLEQLQVRVEEQGEQIVGILKLISNGKSVNPFDRVLETLPVLYQNTPNPFSQSTEIGFYIPKEVQVARLYIYDVNGLQKKSFVISDRENGSVIMDAGALGSGIYYYTLICDSKPVDTKQMILTK